MKSSYPYKIKSNLHMHVNIIEAFICEVVDVSYAKRA